jgi:hypothetical protein
MAPSGYLFINPVQGNAVPNGSGWVWGDFLDF